MKYIQTFIVSPRILERPLRSVWDNNFIGFPPSLLPCVSYVADVWCEHSIDSWHLRYVDFSVGTNQYLDLAQTFAHIFKEWRGQKGTKQTYLTRVLANLLHALGFLQISHGLGWTQDSSGRSLWVGSWRSCEAIGSWSHWCWEAELGSLRFGWTWSLTWMI